MAIDATATAIAAEIGSHGDCSEPHTSLVTAAALSSTAGSPPLQGAVALGSEHRSSSSHESTVDVASASQSEDLKAHSSSASPIIYFVPSSSSGSGGGGGGDHGGNMHSGEQNIYYSSANADIRSSSGARVDGAGSSSIFSGEQTNYGASTTIAQDNINVVDDIRTDLYGSPNLQSIEHANGLQTQLGASNVVDNFKSKRQSEEYPPDDEINKKRSKI